MTNNSSDIAPVDLVQHFEQLQGTPQAPSLTQFVAQHEGIAVGDLAELVMVDQTAGWVEGRRPLVEEYLAQFPVLASQDDELVSLVARI